MTAATEFHATEFHGAGIPGIAGELEVVRQRVVELTELLPAAQEVDALVDTVAAVEALKSSLDLLALRVVAELEATGALKPYGWASTKDFFTSVSGSTRGNGSAAVHLAHDLDTVRFASLAQGLRDGWLSTTKALVITRAINDLPSTADHDRGVAVLLDEARRLDASDLMRVGRHLLTVIDPEGEDRREEAARRREQRAAHERRFLTITDDQAGGAWLRGRCAAEDAALVKSTLMSLTAPQPGVTPPTARSPAARTTVATPATTVPVSLTPWWSRVADCRLRGCCLKTTERHPGCRS
jgi:hypothetical protein